MNVLAAERVRIVPPIMTPSPIEAMVKWLNDPDVVRYSEQRHRKHTVESQIEYVKSFFGSINKFRMIIVDDQFIGTLAAYVDEPNSIANVGILIGQKDQWGKGYGTEAWTAFCNDLLGNGIRKIEAGCMCGNRGMLRIFQKYHMMFEGIRYNHFVISPEETRDLQMWGKWS